MRNSEMVFQYLELEVLAYYVFFTTLNTFVTPNVSKNSLTDSLALTLTYFTNFSDCHVAVALTYRVVFL